MSSAAPYGNPGRRRSVQETVEVELQSRRLLIGLVVFSILGWSVTAWSWDADALAALHEPAATVGTHSYLLVDGAGCVIDQFGDLDEKLQVFSVRKSMNSALIGALVAEGRLDLDATLEALGIDDTGGLSDRERAATVRDLLMARSGVYHQAVYETPGMQSNRPERNSVAPGERWFYNNWDFNTLHTIAERAGGARSGELFARYIATPIGVTGFQDFDAHHIYGPQSEHAAVEFYLDAWDQARFGLLLLHGGRWGDREVLPASWVAESTSPHSDAGILGGYGYS